MAGEAGLLRLVIWALPWQQQEPGEPPSHGLPREGLRQELGSGLAWVFRCVHGDLPRCGVVQQTERNAGRFSTEDDESPMISGDGYTVTKIDTPPISSIGSQIVAHSATRLRQKCV